MGQLLCDGRTKKENSGMMVGTEGAQPVSNSESVKGNIFVKRGVLEFVGILLCLGGIAVAIGMNCSRRSLFCDEAMLVWNINTRSLGTLVARPLDWLQTAPLLYVYTLKLLALLFGTSEWVYRFPALLAYAFLPVAVWWSAKRLFGIAYPWLCAGFCANLGSLLMYSNQAKPYMGEAVLVLAVLAVHYAFVNGKVNWLGRATAWAVLGMCGNPVWFAVAGCLAHEGLESLARRNWKSLAECTESGCVFGGAMGVYFLAWLAPMANADAMQAFWTESMLPWPVTPSGVWNFFRILREHFFLLEFGKREWVMIPLMGLSLVLTLKSRHRWASVVWLTLGAAVCASCLSMFPVTMRLWLFAVPLCALLAFWTIEKISGAGRQAWAGALLALLAIANLGILRYWNPKNNYWENEEINDSVAFLRKHLVDGESVYVFFASIPGFQFNNGYSSSRLAPSSRDNVIFGGRIWENPEDLERDVASVEQSGTCWLVMAHATTSRTKALFDRLSTSGSLEMVHSFFDTPVYLYKCREVHTSPD